MEKKKGERGDELRLRSEDERGGLKLQRTKEGRRPGDEMNSDWRFNAAEESSPAPSTASPADTASRFGPLKWMNASDNRRTLAGLRGDEELRP